MRNAVSKEDVNTADDFAKNNDKNNFKEGNRLTGFAVRSAIFVAFTGSWQCGFSIGSFNPARLPAQNSIREQYQMRWNANVSDAVVNGLWVACSAAYPAGGMFGSLLVGPVVSKFGRLNGLLFIHAITAALSALLGLSKVFQSPEVIVISRFGIGITSGIVTTGVSVMYLVEISPKHVRGKFGGLVAGGITFSIFLGNVLGLPQVFGNERLWPLLFALTGLPSLFFVFIHRGLPESPRKLFIEDKNEDKATEVLRRLNGRENVNDILSEMKNEMAGFRSNGQMTVKEIIFSLPLRRSLVTALLAGAAHQITGLNGITFNMASIYQKAGITETNGYYASIGVTAFFWISALLGILLVDKYGRRKLLLLGYSGTAISMFLLTISLQTQHLSHAMPYVSIAASAGFIISFAIGPAPVTLPIIAEFFEQNARPAAVSLSVTVLWAGFTVAVIVTPYMLEAIKGYAFIPFGILSLLFVTYFWYNVPETKNKSFTEIKKAFRRTKDKENDAVTEEEVV